MTSLNLDKCASGTDKIDDVISLLTEIIAFDSVTPEGKDALEFIGGLLENIGFNVLIKSFDPEQKIFNLYAYRNNDSAKLCFAGHVDVVPAGNINSWRTPPFKLTQEGGIFFGRGMVDMKGAIACFLAALVHFIQNNPDCDNNISILLTTDEEGDGTYGTIKMLEYINSLGHKIDFCLVGEPTSSEFVGDTVKIGRRGSINFDITIFGKQGHVAYPELALNPITPMVKALQELSVTVLEDSAKDITPSNLEITSLDAVNNITNVIPQSANCKFNIRFGPDHSEESLCSWVQKAFSKYSDSYKMTYKCSSLPFLQKIDDNITSFVEIVHHITGHAPKLSTAGGTSDARHIHHYASVVEFGLNSATAHQIDEYTKICDLQTLYNVYYSTLVRFVASEKLPD